MTCKQRKKRRSYAAFFNFYLRDIFKFSLRADGFVDT